MADTEGKVAPAESASAEGDSAAEQPPAPASQTSSPTAGDHSGPPPKMQNRKSERYVPLPGDDPKGAIPRERPIPTGVNVTPHPTIPGKFYVEDQSLVRDQIVVPLYADQGGYYVYRAQVGGDKSIPNAHSK